MELLTDHIRLYPSPKMMELNFDYKNFRYHVTNLAYLMKNLHPFTKIG